MKNVNMSLPKVSVIVPVYNTARFLVRCLKSILSSTYDNIEIIVVDDCSSDASTNIIRRFSSADERVRVVRHEKNLGLFAARLSGIRSAVGDYICFVDSDDYVNEDFIRCLVHRAVGGGFDIVMGDTVHEDMRGSRWIHAGYMGVMTPDRFGDEVLSAFLSQEGYCFLWHAVWNKIYKRSLFASAMPFFESVRGHLIMGEDILFSAVLHYYARSFSKVDYAYYFYIQHAAASTTLGTRAAHFEKCISDLSLVFSSLERFFSDKGASAESRAHLSAWRALYVRFWCSNVKSSRLCAMQKRRMLHRLKEAFGLSELWAQRDEDNWFYSQTVPFDSRYIDLISKIRKYDTLSFDLFDTVLVRKCYKPTDAFRFMDERLSGIFGKRGVFHEARELAEREERRAMGKNEVTLDGIYARLAAHGKFKDSELSMMKQTEIEYERGLLVARKSVLNLMELARHLGKEIIICSDFYMGEDILSGLLKEKGIFCDKLIVSCDFQKTKSSGELFDVLRNSASSTNILHLGDNWHSDYEMCVKNGIDAHFYPSAISCFMNEISDVKSSPSLNVYTSPSGQWISYEHSLDFFEVRCALALSAIRLYDNPYASYLPDSSFNSSGEFIGYYALGMHLWAVARWLYEKNTGKAGRLHFIARDGYLPRLAYDVMNSDGRARSSQYFYASRKALLPLLLIQSSDASEAAQAMRGATGGVIEECLSPVLTHLEIPEGYMREKSLSLDECYEYIKHSLQNRISEEKAVEYLNKIKRYFSSLVSSGDAFFDIGYSGRPIIALSELLGEGMMGFFVHRTSDLYMSRQKELCVNIECLYDYTPAVTGSIREMLFSSQSPSCIGYSTEGAVHPKFEKYDVSYVERFAIDEAQRQALAFVADMKRLYDISPALFFARPMDLSAPYEYLLSCKNRYDAQFFGAVSFEDEVYHGKRKIKLIEAWGEAQDYHGVALDRGRSRCLRRGLLSRSVGEAISARPKFVRALIFLLLDRKTFLEKLKKNLSPKERPD